MNESQDKQNNLLDTTDCLEAVGVFRGWKNFLFIITICCLLLLQASFWLVDRDYVKINGDAETALAVATGEEAGQISKAEEQVRGETEQIRKAAKEAVTDPNQAAEAVSQKPQQKKISLFSRIKFKDLARLIRFLNFVLILAAILYCLTMLFSLKVSLLGRVGGINHISRAFFLSLVFLVLLLPWQRFFAGVVVGAMYTPNELSSSCAAADGRTIFGTIVYYLRFTGYWLLVLLLLVFSQLRSARWAKAILRRLEII